MNRRQLFKRAAAVAVALGLAPAVKAEAAPVDMRAIEASVLKGPPVAPSWGIETGSVTGLGPSYDRWLVITNPDGTITAEYPERTFEVLQARCAALGCPPLTSEPYVNAVYGVPGVVYGHGEDAYVVQGNQSLATVDTWLTGLHESGA